MIIKTTSEKMRMALAFFCRDMGFTYDNQAPSHQKALERFERLIVMDRNELIAEYGDE